jgi:hypothetical protein
MSTPAAPAPQPAVGLTGPNEIRVYSHSSLFYWWPVWFFGFVFALITWIDGGRMAIVDHDSLLIREKMDIGGQEKTVSRIVSPDDAYRMNQIVAPADDNAKKWFRDQNGAIQAGAVVETLKPRVSHRSWMGPTFLFILLLVVLITNVPLRGLWSLVVIITLVVAALLISLFGGWDVIFSNIAALHVFINLAGYLVIAGVLAGMWTVATFVFDRRSYVIFTPGQIRVCEEVGARERTCDTTGLSIEKHRDDWFRHIILGFGTGDLTIRTAGADRHEITMPNIALIGYKIDAIQQMIRHRQIDVDTTR